MVIIGKSSGNNYYFGELEQLNGTVKVIPNEEKGFHVKQSESEKGKGEEKAKGGNQT